MGFDTKLKKIYCFIYKEDVGKGLIEHEYDCVFLGRFNGSIKPNSREVKAYRWAKLSWLRKDIKKNPQKYTPWFKIIIKEFFSRKINPANLI